MTTFTLLNTRPADQAEALQKAVRQIGGQALACPTIRIEPVKLPKAACEDFAQFDKAVFISVNAVEQFLRQCPDLKSRDSACAPELYAIGRATFEAGRRAGLAMRLPEGDQYDSEALLKRKELQSLQDERIVLIKGGRGRSLLRETLTQRGAKLSAWEVYRRAPETLCRKAWKQFQNSPCPVVLATSQSGLQNLILALEKNFAQPEWESALIWLKQQPLVVFSERIQYWAQAQGWKGRIVIVPTHSDSGILQSIEKLLQ